MLSMVSPENRTFEPAGLQCLLDSDLPLLVPT